MTTAKQLAAKLKISVSTVGRALSDDARISKETKLRVKQAAADMGYVVNRAARMMRGASSNLVGLVVPDIRNSFYSTTAHALSKCIEAGGFQLMLVETDDDRAVELRHLRELTGAKVAGVVIVPTAKPHPESVRLLSTIPHIQLLRKNPALGDQWFGIDDTHALHTATRHLLDLGHRRIAYLGGHTGLPTGAARLEGFRSAMRAVSRHQMLEEIGPPSSVTVGRQALRRLLALAKPPTAVVCGAVQITHGVLDEIVERGLRIPEQLSVVGFGDEPGFRWWGPGLTTLAMPISELATASGLWFLHQLKNGATIGMPLISRAQLIVRGSTHKPGPAHISASRGGAQLGQDLS